jgi:predicted GNAT family N-acyltransferase
MPALIGGCQCGAVRYRVNGEVLSHVVCHCESCRRTTGALAVPWFTVRWEDLTFTEGRPAVRTSSPGVQRGRCISCGTALTYESTDQEPGAERTIDLTTCSLDDPSALSPDANIWVADEVPWSRNVHRLPRYPFLRGHGWIEPRVPLRKGLRLRQVVYAGYRDTLLSVRVPVFVDELGIERSRAEDQRDAESIHLLALHADRAVGTARLDLGRQGRIDRVAVLQDYRGRDIGRAMLLTFHDLARAAGLAAVWSHAPAGAAGFFEHLGYRRDGDAKAEDGLELIPLRRDL